MSKEKQLDNVVDAVLSQVSDSYSYVSQEENAKAFNDLLAFIEFSSSSQRNKGTLFEILVVDYFTYDKKFLGLFSKVQLYEDWAAEHPNLAHNRKDVGIDIVATNVLKGDVSQLGKTLTTFTAIQCKCYAKHAIVPKAGIDSFCNASDKVFFPDRYIVATNLDWTNNALNNLADKLVPVKIITRKDLENSSINWRVYLDSQQTQIQYLTRSLRPYQLTAFNDVIAGFTKHDRGNLIMACGTGKTYIALKIAEHQACHNGLVLVLVPSISLLSQWLTEWKYYSDIYISVFAVCSDKKVGYVDDDVYSINSSRELTYPSTTNPELLAYYVAQSQSDKEITDKPSMTVILSTYQSIDVVHRAQVSFGMSDIDLVIGDEAHRTTGYNYSYSAATSSQIDSLMEDSSSEALFTRVHNQDYIRANKRLYMTATAKIVVDKDDRDCQDDVMVYSMDDETIYGPNFHTLSFYQAVKLGCLVDFELILLTLDYNTANNLESLKKFSQSNCDKIIGTVKALNKFGLQDELQDDPNPIKRSVAFTQVIDSNNPKKVSSKQFTNHFLKVSSNYKDFIELKHESDPLDENIAYEYNFFQSHPLTFSCKHIDGYMDALQKNSLIEWLKEDSDDCESKILFNVRCLTEGIDVPSLDAVIFLSPRQNVIEVIQAVGRVMRKSPGKRRGYVIIPVIVNDPDCPEKDFNRLAEFKIVWQVLNAIKSIYPEQDLCDSRLNKLDSRIRIVNGNFTHKSEGSLPSDRVTDIESLKSASNTNINNSIMMDFLEKIRAVVIKKLGNRKSWEMWARDVAEICQEQIQVIDRHLEDDKAIQDRFLEFKQDLSFTLRTALSNQEVVEMLAQHIVIKPILDELFRGYPFTERNPIAKVMTQILNPLEAKGFIQSNPKLQGFYDSVAQRMKNVQTLEDRQTVIVDLFENFFKHAFPKLREKLGIVYTPVEVVDFINNSVNDLLKINFNLSLQDTNVHVLDPFAGTGTFIARMLANPNLISTESLDHKYLYDLHAYEIVPLAYYIASINVEAVYASRINLSPDDYAPNNITVLTDTFADRRDCVDIYGSQAINNSELESNELKREMLEHHSVSVIIGNPPYSVGQTRQNDDNQNSSYPTLEKRISETYVETAGKISNKNSLYDSYIKAFRWGTDQIGDRGIIAFVSNAGWLDSTAAKGMRQCLQDDFSSIYIYHLKGNARTVGEERRKEKDNIFGPVSRAPIAITVLVKNPESANQGSIYFGAIDDYLLRQDKLQQLLSFGSIINVPLQHIMPNEHNDWINQRQCDFSKFLPVSCKSKNEQSIFKLMSNGVKTSRDPWSYNASRQVISDNFNKCIAFYNFQVDKAISLGESFEPSNDESMIKWDERLINSLNHREKYQPFDPSCICFSLYRPFFKEMLYFDIAWISRRYQMSKIFPYEGAENLTIDISGVGSKSFSCLMTNMISCLDCVDKTQCFPRYVYRKITRAGCVDACNGYVREDAISAEALNFFREAYPSMEDKITSDSVFYYVYGILHSEDYRDLYANNLKKELPRIPRVASFADFETFERVGRKLADIHVNYEQMPIYSGCQIDCKPNANYLVSQIKYGRIPGKKGGVAQDKTTIIYNDDITICNVPIDAQSYLINKKSALDWVVDRCGVRCDKTSGIVNNYNDYAKEVKDEKYILNLILRVITVSLETIKLVKSLPKLDVHPLDR